MEGRSVDSEPAYSMCTFLIGGMEMAEEYVEWVKEGKEDESI